MAVGAVLRLRHLGAVEFKGDEQEALNLGIRLLADHPWSSSAPWPAHGMLSSNSVANAPLLNWLMAGAWAMSHDPVWATALVAVVNAMSLYPLWLWARRHMDEQRALLTLAIAAVSPFTVILSRKLWGQDLLLPGVLAALWAIDEFRRGRWWRAVALSGVATLVMGQLHQSGAIGLVLLPLAAAVQWVIDRKNTDVRPPLRLARPTWGEVAAIVAVAGLNLFFWMPYFSYLIHLPLETFANRPQLDVIRPVLLEKIGQQVMPLDLFFFVDREDFLRGALRSFFYYTGVGLGAPLFFYGLWRWLRAPSSLPVVGVWWWCIIAFFTLARIPCYPFYVLSLAPITSVLAAGAFDGPCARTWRPRVFTVLRAAYVAALLGLTITFQNWVVERGGSRGDYGVVYEVRLAQAQAAVSRLNGTEPRRFYTRGEAQPEELGAAACHDFPVELNWLVRWIDPAAADRPRPFSLCDTWIERDDRLVYRWMLSSS